MTEPAMIARGIQTAIRFLDAGVLNEEESPMLIDVEIYRLDRNRGSGLIVEGYGNRNEACLIRRGVVRKIHVRGLVGAHRSRTVMRNDRPRSYGDGVRDVASRRIGILDGNGYRLGRSPGYRNG